MILCTLIECNTSGEKKMTDLKVSTISDMENAVKKCSKLGGNLLITVSGGVQSLIVPFNITCIPEVKK